MTEMPVLELESLTREHFADKIGETFDLLFSDGSRHPLELTEVRDVFVGGDREGKRQAFALGFLGSSTAYVKQATHIFEHPGLGRVGFFLVPLGPAPKSGRMQYEAIFT